MALRLPAQPPGDGPPLTRPSKVRTARPRVPTSAIIIDAEPQLRSSRRTPEGYGSGRPPPTPSGPSYSRASGTRGGRAGCSGHERGGWLRTCPVHHLPSGYEGEEGIAIPTEAFLSTDTQRELAKSGVLALASAPNSDAVYLQSAPTAYVTPPKKTYDSATTEPEVRLERVSLVDQLFVARLVHFLRALCSKLPTAAAPAEAQSVVEGGLWALFEGAPPASVDFQVTAQSKGGQAGTTVQVTVRPRRYLGVSIEEIGLEMPLG